MRKYDQLQGSMQRLLDLLVCGIAFRVTNNRYSVYSHHGDHIGDIADCEMNFFIWSARRLGVEKDRQLALMVTSDRPNRFFSQLAAVAYNPEHFGLTSDDVLERMHDLWVAQCEREGLDMTYVWHRPDAGNVSNVNHFVWVAPITGASRPACH